MMTPVLTDSPQARRQSVQDVEALHTALDGALASHIGGPAICHLYAPDNQVDITCITANSSSPHSGLSRNSPFRIASVTKIYTAAAIFRLWEQDRLLFEQTLPTLVSSETLSTLRQGGYAVDRIRLKHLLAHTAGIYDHCHDPDFIRRVVTEPEKRWTRLEQLRFAIDHGGPYGPPGAQQHYSDTGYILLGEIIERASGLALGAALHALLKFDALGLAATQMEDETRCVDPLTPLFHSRLAGRLTDDLHPSFDLFGGGGLVSTARETALFLRALLSGQIFERPQTLAAALAIPPIPLDPTNGRIRSYLLYRTGFLGRDAWTHTGFWGNETLYCPSLDLAVTFSVFEGAEEGRERRQNLRSGIEAAIFPFFEPIRLP